MTYAGSAGERAEPPSPAKVRGPRRLIADAHQGFGPFSFAFLSVLLGVAAGFGAFVFRSLIALIHNLFFLGHFSVHYDTSQHTPPSPWGGAVVLAPVLGAIAVVFLVKNFAPEAKGRRARGHGRHLLRQSRHPACRGCRQVGRVRHLDRKWRFGRSRGSIVHTSAASASWLGGFVRVSRWQRATLVAAGGGAGIAATFNTPLGGVLFAVEVLMHEVSVRTLVPVALATATATYVGRQLFGNAPAFAVPPVHASLTAAVLPAYVVLGALMALVAVAFIRALYGAEDFFETAIPRRDYVRHMVGMLGVGLAIEATMVLGGHYYVEGVGYATIVDVLTGKPRRAHGSWSFWGRSSC